MGHQDLIAVLRAQGTEKTAEMRRQADEAAARIIAEGRARIETLEKEKTLARQTEEQRLKDAITSQAKIAARRLLAASRSRLAERLSLLARDCLSSLRNENYETTFARLAEEPPRENWQSIRVNPADAGLAGKYFPTAPVVEDEAVVGGFELISEDSLLQLNNTLRKRLERSWASILPTIVAQLEKECMDR